MFIQFQKLMLWQETPQKTNLCDLASYLNKLVDLNMFLLGFKSHNYLLAWQTLFLSTSILSFKIKQSISLVFMAYLRNKQLKLR